MSFRRACPKLKSEAHIIRWLIHACGNTSCHLISAPRNITFVTLRTSFNYSNWKRVQRNRRNKPNMETTLLNKFQEKQTWEEGGSEPEWHQPDQQKNQKGSLRRWIDKSTAGYNIWTKTSITQRNRSKAQISEHEQLHKDNKRNNKKTHNKTMIRRQIETWCRQAHEENLNCRPQSTSPKGQKGHEPP